MITANDLYYLPRVKNLEGEYKKMADRLFELQEQMESYIDFETCDPILLNIMEDKKWQLQELMESIEDHIIRLKSEALN